MDLLEMGITAARSGNRDEARMLLEAVTLQEPDNEQAFLWLSFVLDDPELSMRCLERVLELDPGNQRAERGLAWLRSQQGDEAEALPERLSDTELRVLLQALKQPDERAVLGAIRRLGEAGDSRAVEPLLNLLVSTPSETIRGHARVALTAIGTPAVGPVSRRLMGERAPKVATQLAGVLARVRSMAALEACRDVVDRAKHPVARYAIALNLIVSAHGEVALGIVRDYVAQASQDERARAAIVMAVGQAVKAGALEARPGLQTLMAIWGNSSLSPALRRSALTALGVSSQPSVVKHLFEATADRDEHTRVAAVDALARFDPPQVDLLDRLARSTDPLVRARANLILDKLPAA
ncbi:MAG TPA: hypothetical protein ENN19_00875 [Chloroflexi bacterium]|nr:hypothetical protein [Chloroflexota bacterium]